MTPPDEGDPRPARQDVPRPADGVELHVCMRLNACAGPGGCGYLRHEAEQAVPGTGVWRRARRVLEARMYEAHAPLRSDGTTSGS